MIQFSVFFVIFQAIRGVCEGMTMHMADLGGVRRHRWFRYYHRLRVVELLSLTLAVWGAARVDLALSMFPLALAIGLIGWEVFELGYAKARYRRYFPENEHLFGAEWDIGGEAGVLLLHILRVVSAALLIIGGVT